MTDVAAISLFQSFDCCNVYIHSGKNNYLIPCGFCKFAHCKWSPRRGTVLHATMLHNWHISHFVVNCYVTNYSRHFSLGAQFLLIELVRLRTRDRMLLLSVFPLGRILFTSTFYSTIQRCVDKCLQQKHYRQKKGPVQVKWRKNTFKTSQVLIAVYVLARGLAAGQSVTRTGRPLNWHTDSIISLTQIPKLTFHG